MKLCILVVAAILFVSQIMAADNTPWGAEKGGLASRLTSVTEKPAVGRPLRLKLEIKNRGSAPAKYDDQQAAVNGSLIITGPDGAKVPFIGGTFQTFGAPTTLKPGESKTIFEKLDIAEQYLIEVPGQYRIQARGGSGVPESNVLTVAIGPGTPSDFQKLLGSLRKVMPAGWRVSNYSGSIVFLHSPTGLKADTASITLFFAKDPIGGIKPQPGQPSAINLGETNLGRAWLSAESQTAVDRWPDYAKVIGDQVRAMKK